MRDDLLWLTAYAGCVTSIVIFMVSGGVLPLQNSIDWISRQTEAAALFFVPSITTTQLQNAYRGAPATDPVTGFPQQGTAKKVRILIVPGHQPDIGGAEFGTIQERDVVVSIAEALAGFIAANPHYEVMVARDTTAWHPILQKYFDTNTLAITTFEESQKAQMREMLANGRFTVDPNQGYHDTVNANGAYKLYGINKWANDNHYDITLHLHLNDIADRRVDRAGEESGFSVYVPDHQYSNAVVSKAIGEAIAVRLNAYHATSTLPQERAGVVEDRELIAVGSNNSADAAALLIEYAYIYEPQLQDASVRSVAIDDYAYATYLGLQDFFRDPAHSEVKSAASLYDWSTVTAKKNEKGPGIYVLQTALHTLGYYPPRAKSFSDCPISGSIGPCTRTALEAYQAAKHLEITGMLGPQTRAMLTQDLSGIETVASRDIFKSM